uniref:Uncharacterized protein n=1 Tax=Chromera velia CCMP2878 TaxID=1169474 RepID=A0A0G4FFP6_9ALVE|eukprot:Cvel_16728.t1-p1 / transcript=Cvel_16728.t1 / gene=Cvel_16728 / organism=Chromera_velia_CCMP2878 / gene_product=hypothetical protein / transcript_product=hypothetical protein / location=Cvel_scaffold1301:11689-23231(-) / protein_length=1147 / sequence_SO=supercontig / SO=protein_coding / is_pseudo=false
MLSCFLTSLVRPKTATHGSKIGCWPSTPLRSLSLVTADPRESPTSPLKEPYSECNGNRRRRRRYLTCAMPLFRPMASFGNAFLSSASLCGSQAGDTKGQVDTERKRTHPGSPSFTSALSVLLEAHASSLLHVKPSRRARTPHRCTGSASRAQQQLLRRAEHEARKIFLRFRRVKRDKESEGQGDLETSPQNLSGGIVETLPDSSLKGRLRHAFTLFSASSALFRAGALRESSELSAAAGMVCEDALFRTREGELWRPLMLLQRESQALHVRAVAALSLSASMKRGDGRRDSKEEQVGVSEEAEARLEGILAVWRPLAPLIDDRKGGGGLCFGGGEGIQRRERDGTGRDRTRGAREELQKSYAARVSFGLLCLDGLSCLLSAAAADESLSGFQQNREGTCGEREGEEVRDGKEGYTNFGISPESDSEANKPRASHQISPRLLFPPSSALRPTSAASCLCECPMSFICGGVCEGTASSRIVPGLSGEDEALVWLQQGLVAFCRAASSVFSLHASSVSRREFKGSALKVQEPSLGGPPFFGNTEEGHPDKDDCSAFFDQQIMNGREECPQSSRLTSLSSAVCAISSLLPWSALESVEAVASVLLWRALATSLLASLPPADLNPAVREAMWEAGGNQGERVEDSDAIEMKGITEEGGDPSEIVRQFLWRSTAEDCTAALRVDAFAFACVRTSPSQERQGGCSQDTERGDGLESEKETAFPLVHRAFSTAVERVIFRNSSSPPSACSAIGEDDKNESDFLNFPALLLQEFAYRQAGMEKEANESLERQNLLRKFVNEGVRAYRQSGKSAEAAPRPICGGGEEESGGALANKRSPTSRWGRSPEAAMRLRKKMERVCCEPATCASVLLTGGNSYDCTSLGLNNYDATKRGSVPCPGGLASGCRGDLTVCCEPATCESALPSDGFPCASAGLNDFQRTLKGGVICPEGIADGCLNDLTVCCEPATCLSAAPLDGYVCVLAGLNNFDADLKAGKFCPGGTAAGCLNDLSVCCEPATCFSVAEGGGEFGCSDAGFVDFNEFIRSDVPCPGGAASGCLGDPKVYLPVLLRALLKGSRPCPLGLPSLCLDDPSVCCEAATCESALNYNNRDGYDCTGLGEYVSGVQGPIPCPSGTPDSCNPTWCCSLGVNCENCSDER